MSVYFNDGILLTTVVQNLSCRQHSSVTNYTLLLPYVPPVASTWLVLKQKWIMYLKSAREQQQNHVATSRVEGTWFMVPYCVLCTQALNCCIHIRLLEQWSIKMLMPIKCLGWAVSKFAQMIPCGQKVVSRFYSSQSSCEFQHVPGDERQLHLVWHGLHSGQGLLTKIYLLNC